MRRCWRPSRCGAELAFARLGRPGGRSGASSGPPVRVAVPGGAAEGCAVGAENAAVGGNQRLSARTNRTDAALHSLADAALAAARVADLALIPCRPALADLHAIMGSLGICPGCRCAGGRRGQCGAARRGACGSSPHGAGRPGRRGGAGDHRPACRACPRVRGGTDGRGVRARREGGAGGRGACTTSTRPAPTAAADRKVLLVRLDPDTMRRLKHLAVDRDCTLQALAAEAIDLLFEAVRGLRPD